MPWNDASKPEPDRGPWDPPDRTDAGRGEREHTPDPKRGKLGQTAEPRPLRRTPPHPSGVRRPEPPIARGPDLDRLTRELRARFSGASGNVGRRRRPVLIASALLAGLACGWAASGIVQVGSGEQAVITRFDGSAVRVGPGVRYHWPWPLGAATVTPAGGEMRTAGQATLRTPGGNSVRAAFLVDWRPVDAARLAARFADPVALVRTAAAAAVRQTFSNQPLAVLASPDRGYLQLSAASALQASLDRAKAGVHVQGLTLGSLDPPDAARPAFDALEAEARSAAATAQADAAERARALDEARADAAKEVAAAQIARDQEISDAKGEASRFLRIDTVARKAPAITRERLYTETMQRILHDVRKVMVQLPPGGQVVLPPDALQPSAPAASPSHSQAAPSP